MASPNPLQLRPHRRAAAAERESARGGRTPCPVSTSTGFPELPLLNPHFPSSTSNLYQDLQGAYAGAIHVSSVIGGSLSHHRL